MFGEMFGRCPEGAGLNTAKKTMMYAGESRTELKGKSMKPLFYLIFSFSSENSSQNPVASGR